MSVELVGRYGMFGMSRDHITAQYGFIDLWPEDAVAGLTMLTPDQIAHREVNNWALTRPATLLWIFYNGQWWEVVREDLCKQVRTGRYNWTIEGVIRSIVYGVRLDEERQHFIVIDSLTDG